MTARDATEALEGLSAKRQSPIAATLRRLMHHRLFVLGLFLVAIVAGMAILAPWIAPSDPNKLAMRFKFSPPSGDFLFGTDNFGRSLWSRVVWGARLSMYIGSSVVLKIGRAHV